ncbi:serine protease [Kitasatospora sp. SUK 42]|uniref:trypsin-like serine peptidase n=1 Tax=Kitasatospora sp. SUK 42 TaxID=1588882 RepID=UPI001C3183DB|nr:peptidase [Kitasatospora sp. SUK 42]MBV2153174.1 peptidase [Kitasatospora sp. SUK 42]
MSQTHGRIDGHRDRIRGRARTRFVLTTAVLAAGTVLAAPAGAAGHAAKDGAATTSRVVVHPEAVTAAQQQAVLDHWTPERMAALTTPSSDNPPKAAPDGAPWTGADALSRTVGRLFFTDHGEDESCTATVVNSANRSTVVTAGHCVNSPDLLGENDELLSNEMFVPGYRDGLAPYGRFVARAGVADATWLLNDEQNALKYDAYDQAFLVLNTNTAGKRVQDAVGAAQRIGFDRPGSAPVHEFGYPREASGDPTRAGLPEYTGARLAHCVGQTREYPGTVEHPEPRGEWGAPCVMGGGSSGGPRVADFDPSSGIGTVVGDNTQGAFFDSSGRVCARGDEACTRHLVGPQFTSAITKPLYKAAERS